MSSVCLYVWIRYKTLPLSDDPATQLSPFFESAFEFIKEGIENGQGVLVHCYAGQSRSASIVIAYLMKEKSLTLDESLKLLREKRPCVCPNMGFFVQLRSFEKKLIQQKEPKNL